MNRIFTISIYLDRRRKKDNDKYPVKLRVFTANPRVQKLYPTIFEYSINEFKSIWETSKPRKEHQEARKKLQAIEIKANEIAKNIEVFTFEQFEKKLFRKRDDGSDLLCQYELTIEKLTQHKQLGTAGVYIASLNSINNFMKYKNGKEPIRLPFIEITVDWLTQYESYMIDYLKRSRNTVSMYLRTLRTLYNDAIIENEIGRDYYPFGKRKFEIPSSKGVKKALNKAELKMLFDSKPQTPEQEKAKDFWFFSYACNGMNIKDIAYLKYNNIQNDKIIFYRAKTINTKKTDSSPVVVYLNKLSKKIIDKYGNNQKDLNQYVFPIITNSIDYNEQHRKVKNFTRFINQNIKKLAKTIELNIEISTYSARHSFATNAINNGASMEFVSEALNHSDMKVTQGYFAGFEEKDKKELMDKLIKFD